MSDDAQEAALGLLGLFNNPSQVIPQKRKPPPPVENSDSIRCICSYTHDDGWSVACDRCGRWYHGACVDIAPGAVPQTWVCPEHDDSKDPIEEQARRERAQTLQRQYQKRLHEQASRRRGTSPGVEKKQRRINSGELKRRRRSLSKAMAPSQPISAVSQPMVAATTTDEDENVVIDVEDTYVAIQHDAVPLQETRERLARNAQNWRGITALDVDDETFIQPTSNNDPLRPVEYGLHTSVPVRRDEFIAPYTSTVTPSSDYLSDPLNAYAHLGMPKPFVHIIGPPHNVALDSRIRGSRARFARSGCHPNAALRPYLCADKISFGIFALRDLKPNEEVILGWEWDDGNAIHHLPALLEHPELFTQEQHNYLRFQLANLLHSLGSTFATCACGADSKHCALKRVVDFVDGVDHVSGKPQLGPLVGVKRGFRTKEKVPMSSGLSGVKMVDQDRLRAIGIDYQEATPPEETIPPEEALPPRMRKRWIHEQRDQLKQTPEPMQVDETPRPKMPPPTISNFPPPAPSPSVQFANLSLSSPAFAGMVPSPLTNGTTEEPHVRFATAPPIIHPPPSPPQPSPTDLKMKVDAPTESRSLSNSPNPSPRFEPRTFPTQSPETTPSPPEIPEQPPPPESPSESQVPPSPPTSHSPPVSESPLLRTPTPPPAPAPPAKVKMSLKDFAMMRKKKQSEQGENKVKDVEEDKKAAEEEERKRVEEKERLRQAHIHRSTLSFGAFGIDDADEDMAGPGSRSVSPVLMTSTRMVAMSTPSPSVSPDIETISLSPVPEPISPHPVEESPTTIPQALPPVTPQPISIPPPWPHPPPASPSLQSLVPPAPNWRAVPPSLPVPQTPTPRSPSPADQEEGEIPTASPPPSLKHPPTQPRSFSASRPPPSGPRALRNGGTTSPGMPMTLTNPSLVQANGAFRGGWRGRGRGSWVR